MGLVRHYWITTKLPIAIAIITGAFGFIHRPYAAPEVIERGDYTGPSDRFALAKVACAVLLGHTPPAGPDSPRLRTKLRAVEVLDRRSEILDHLMTMLAPFPGNRPAPATPWLVELIDMLVKGGLPTRSQIEQIRHEIENSAARTAE